MATLEVDDLIVEKVKLYAEAIDPRYRNIYKIRDIANEVLSILKSPGANALPGRLIPNSVFVEVWRDQLQHITFSFKEKSLGQNLFTTIEAKDVPKVFVDVQYAVWYLKWTWMWLHLSLVLKEVYEKVDSERYNGFVNFWEKLGGILEGRVCSFKTLV